MEVEEIKRVISDQREILEEKLSRNVIMRNTPDLLKYLQIPNVLAILGVRRSGKSTLASLLVKDKKFSYVNFDDERFYNLKTEDLNKILQAIYELYDNVDYIILDEVHNVPGWELFVSRLREFKRVIVTGSNSKMLSGELATYLTGRHSDYILFPFSFREYLTFKGIKVNIYSTRNIATLRRELENYMDTGGFPEALILGREQVNVIYNDILFKDVISRYKIKEISKFRDFAKTLISYYSNEVSFLSLSKTLKVDRRTIENWAFALEEAYLIFFLPRYGEKLRQRLTFNKKLYVVDSGVISNVAIKEKDKGRVIENLVAIKLYRELQNLDRLYYVKNDFEVDFYDERNSRLIQVTYASDKIEEREIKGLIKGKEITKSRDLIIVSWDLEEELEVKGEKIRVIPLYKFLLS